MTDENKPTAEPILKKNIPDVLYPGVPIEEAAEEQKEIAAGAGSDAPKTAEEIQKKREKEEAEVKVAAIIYNAFSAFLFLKLGEHGFGIDTTLSNLYALGKDIRPHLLLFSAIICLVAASFSIIPALFIRFVVIGKPLNKLDKRFSYVPTFLTLCVVALLIKIGIGVIFIPVWFLLYFFTIHIFTYGKGGLFKIFFKRVSVLFKNAFSNIFG